MSGLTRYIAGSLGSVVFLSLTLAHVSDTPAG